jgi:L-2-hydroxyglutarate oxidase LhgO
MDRVDCVIIGAGVIGLAIARNMALSGFVTILLEKERGFGSVTSSRNSEVIHAGIYYPKNSLKAQLCVEGNRLLYDYCQDHNVTTRACGKLIVATSNDQLDILNDLFIKALDNGVRGMKMLTQAQANELESELSCKKALLSQSTGIIDSHGLMLSLLGDFNDAGGVVVYKAPFIKANPLGCNAEHGFEVEVGGNDEIKIQTRYLINCAGLSATQVAHKIDGLSTDKIPKAYYAKGNYFSLIGKSPFKHLIYPIPEPGGLGVHLTLDVSGRAKFGPDVEWLKIEDEQEIDYKVDPRRGDSFYSAIRQYWPSLNDGSLVADYSGVRAKIIGADRPAGDFIFDSPYQHQLQGLYNLYGFESPGLTACLAIAQHLDALINDS